MLIPATTRVPPGGSVVLTGTAGTAVATTVFFVRPGPRTTLSIETAPDGAGQPFPPTVVTSGNTTTLFAVGRDAFGNFVYNANATWTAVPVVGDSLRRAARPPTWPPWRARSTSTPATGSRGRAGPGDGRARSTGRLHRGLSGPHRGRHHARRRGGGGGRVVQHDRRLQRARRVCRRLSGTLTPVITGPFANGTAFISLRVAVPWSADCLLFTDGNLQRVAELTVRRGRAQVLSIAPATGYVSGGDTVTVSGTGFNSNDVVTLGGARWRTRPSWTRRQSRARRRPRPAGSPARWTCRSSTSARP